MEIQVEIISPTQAKELHRWGENPIKHYRVIGKIKYMNERINLGLWEFLEQNRRVFEIEDCKSGCDKYGLLSECSGGNKRCKVIGSIHTAEVIEGTNKCIIV